MFKRNGSLVSNTAYTIKHVVKETSVPEVKNKALDGDIATFETELVKVLKGFDELSCEEKQKIQTILFREGISSRVLEISNKLHISYRCNEVKIEVLKLLLDKKIPIDSVYLMDIIGNVIDNFCIFINANLPTEYDQRLADFLEAASLWTEELMYLATINRQPVVDVCVKQLLATATDENTQRHKSMMIIGDLLAEGRISLGQACSAVATRTKDDAVIKAFIAKHPGSERYFQLG